MYYALMGEDVPGTLNQRMAARADHLKRLQQLQADAPTGMLPSWARHLPGVP